LTFFYTVLATTVGNDCVHRNHSPSQETNAKTLNGPRAAKQLGPDSNE
jgi:hypothetical protein